MTRLASVVSHPPGQGGRRWLSVGLVSAALTAAAVPAVVSAATSRPSAADSAGTSDPMPSTPPTSIATSTSTTTTTVPDGQPTTAPPGSTETTVTTAPALTTATTNGSTTTSTVIPSSTPTIAVAETTTTTTTTTTAPPNAAALAPPPPTCAVNVTVRANSIVGARCVETRLKQLGYTGQVPDDFFNATSVQALRLFQSGAGLSVTGVANSTVLQALGIWQAPAAPTCTVNVTVRTNSIVGARCVESRLRQLGFTGQTPDDTFNATSVLALQAFQRSAGLAATGIANSTTLQALGIWRAPPAGTCTVSVTVRSGSVVGTRCVESRLRQLGFTGQTPDDTFNQTSVQALQAFERSAGLIADGVAAPETLQVLGIWRAPASPTCTLGYTVRLGSTAGARCVETRLRQLGFSGQTPDDAFNATSVIALGAFQHSAGLTSSGVAARSTLEALGIWRSPAVPICTISNVVEIGRSTGVRCLETRLKQIGLSGQTPDDSFNPTSVQALRMFQFSAGLPASGIGDRSTLQALGVWKQPAGCSRCTEIRILGTSFLGRPIQAFRFGTPGGRVVVVVGSIHGNEQAGHQIARYLQDSAVIPGSVDLWVIDTVNPDGVFRSTRTNANGVDLNRNFLVGWTAFSCSANPTRCPGPSPASEPETRAVQGFVLQVRPSVVIFYHGADNTVDGGALSAVANPVIVRTYAAAAGMALATVPCLPLGFCTGTATQFINRNVAESSAFVVELASKSYGALSAATVLRNVNALFRALAA